MAKQLQLRRGNLSWWITNNPVLADGEMVLVSTTNDYVYDQYRIGDGLNTFSSLAIHSFPFNTTIEQFLADAEAARDAAQLAETNAETAETNAEAAEALAEKWATNPENVIVEAGKYSALHWSAKAEDEKLAAEAFKNKADKFANESEDVEVESGKYSAKHYSLKAAASAAGIADSAEMLIKHEAEIASLENTINSANINQETTATVTGVDTVALPKTAANTGMSVQLFGQSAQNLVVNGDFEFGIVSNWAGIVPSQSTEQYKSGTKSAFFNLNNQVSYSRIDILCQSTDKIYLAFSRRFKLITLSGTNTVRITDYGLLTNVETLGAFNNGTLNTWSDFSAVVNGRVGGIRFTFGFLGASTAEFFVDDIKAINLTSTYGAGNEPTKEQCDILFANYFEGSDNVLGTGRVRSVGKNLLPLLDGWSSITSLGTNFLKISNSEFKIKTGSTLRSAFIKVKAGDIFTLSHNASASTRRYLYYYDNNLNNVAIYSTTALGNWTSPAATVDGYLRIEYLPLTAQTDFVTVTNWQLERSSTATAYEPYRPSFLYLTTPELRSNALIKDEIRKGTNGYELVKRVGVGTLGANGIAGGDFEGGLAGNMDTIDGVVTWTLNTTNPISGTQDGRLQVTTIGTNTARPRIRFSPTRSNGQYRKISFSYKVNSGVCILNTYDNGGGIVSISTTLSGSGVFELYYLCLGTNLLALNFNGTNLFDLQIDNVKDELINTPDGAATGNTATVIGSNINYTLATPVITPISHAGLLNSNSNGTAYFEPIIADAGVYSSNIAIQLTDYPIASFESIRKYANGTYTELNTATAVIASGGLSFTHPDLASGDLVMFTYAYNRESIGRSMTLTHYDSRFVEADTANGKVYRIVPVVTNGVVSWTAVEV